MQGVLGGSSPRSDARTVVRCLDWLLAHGEPIEEKLWQEAYDIALHCTDPRAQLRAIELIGDRIDPPPKATDEQRGPVSIHVAIVTTDRAGLPSQGNGVAVRIGRGNGDSA
jgi:hypothetical protein